MTVRCKIAGRKRVASFPLALVGLLFQFCVSDAVASPATDAEVKWDNAAMQGVRDAKMGAPMAARALAIVHTCMYDAWAAYDGRAVGTQLSGALRRPTQHGHLVLVWRESHKFGAN